jgi:hypothetical protein
MAARHVLSALAVAAVVVACFDDLPPATPPTTDGGSTDGASSEAGAMCPPPAKFVGGDKGDCGPLLAKASDQVAGNQCIPQEGPALAAYLCLLGDTHSACQCTGAQCSDAAAACYGGDACPPLADGRGRTCPKAKTPPLSPRCSCGCTACAIACDGDGPVFGYVAAPGAQPTGLLEIPIADVLPSAGNVGAYVRVRGVGAVTVFVQNAAGALLGGLHLQPLTADFADIVVPPSITPSQAPARIIVATSGAGSKDPGITLVQVDCAMPIVQSP